MKKTLIVLIGALWLFGCTAQTSKRIFAVPFAVEMPLSALLGDEIIALEVTVLDDLTKDNSVIIYQGSHIESFYSERRVRVDRVLKGETKLDEGSEIEVIGSVASIDDNIFEVYEGAYENRLMKNDNLVLFVKYQPEYDLYGIYNIGHAAVNLSKPANDYFSLFTRLYFYDTTINKNALRTIKSEGISMWKEGILKQKKMTLLNGKESELEINYVYDSATNQTHIVLHEGFSYSFVGKVFQE